MRLQNFRLVHFEIILGQCVQGELLWSSNVDCLSSINCLALCVNVYPVNSLQALFLPWLTSKLVRIFVLIRIQMNLNLGHLGL